jgi:ATP-binding cassette subfamily C (CFTR/MRP) protein 4
MDEATSNVDIRTDACIQKAIRDTSSGIFCNASVLTIAHRLNTVIDYDKILVLDDGKVVEFGPPYQLLDKPVTEESAYFARLIAEMDSEVQQLLRKMSTRNIKRNQ